MISPLASSRSSSIRALSSLVAGCVLAVSAIVIVVLG
jgi:hypothetical protein